MRNVIVGTAGHVDHGKTCLIKALTGIDTDRLEEEKRRGITIELGFAEMPNDRGIDIGVIDVPGHEKFIKNMLAGIGGIDIVLLIIAADEGIMPQTVEHFEVLKLLGINAGIIVLTKTDLVSREGLETVRDDVKKLIDSTFLANAPVMEVSAVTGQNIQELKDLICELAEKSESRREHPEFLRIPIDRVFTIDGFGTVITGTLIQGSIIEGQEVEIYPCGKTAKVRNLQVHGVMVERAFSGQRTAVNLSNIKKEDLRRGDVLAAKGALTASRMLDVKIVMVKDSPRRLSNGSRLHLHYGSAEVLCKVVLLDAEFLDSGQSGYAQLRLEKEIAVRKDDRFVLRFYSPLETIGGGIVLDSDPLRRKRFDPVTLAALEVKATGNDAAILEQVLMEESKKLRPLSEIGNLLSLTYDEVNEMAKPLLKAEKAIELAENIVVHRAYLDLAAEEAVMLLKTYHEEKPTEPGMIKEEFRKKLGEKLRLDGSKRIDALIERLSEEKILAANGNRIALSKFAVSYTPMEQELKDRLEEEYKSYGYEVPTIEDLLAREQDRSRSSAKQMIEALRSEGRLERLTENHYIHTDNMADALKQLKDFLDQKGQITLSEYRDLLGTSRKYAVLILEYSDRCRMTKLINDVRYPAR